MEAGLMSASVLFVGNVLPDKSTQYLGKESTTHVLSVREYIKIDASNFAEIIYLNAPIYGVFKQCPQPGHK